eukprot:CAMPEP_0178395682 /NCGR_PEP_ID=MMETSP0689_2-20121128/13344_1 /TAXON_ID=160604 /ORGANISM="Amphidinium massartii, Strain CS-259" /LENGTH=539 /DNA_ID=CAMNT_0020016343 /DNA_START=211 /DNA_END=1830 /DNA_ORIENTATION=+
MSNFQELSLMQPHESVLTSLLEPGDEMPMHFISHEWLSFKHPDPRGIQLKRMQQVFSRFDSGEQADLFKEEDYDAFLKGVSAGTSRAMSHIEVSISTRDFRSGTEFFNEVVSGFVWLDYHSIPQASKDEDFYKAVNSIPRFVNRCDYFWVCAPTAMHEELQQQRDFSSWRRRGWCRLEETTNFLSTNLKMPLVVTDQEKLSMYGFFDGLSMYTNRPERSVFNGTFTCCQLGHRCEKPDGSYEDIVCDKYAIAELLMAVFERFLLKPCGDQCYRRNLILSLAQSFFAGDPVDEERWLPPEDESVQDCLDRIRFESLDSVDGVGWNPVVWILAVGSMPALREVCLSRPDLLEVTPDHGFTHILRATNSPAHRFKEFILLHESELRLKMINKPSKMGITPVDRAAKHGFCVNLKLLLEAKADAEPRRKDNGATPLHGAAVEHYPNCCELLLQHGADVNGLDKDGNTPLHLAVNPLTVTGNPEVNATVDVIAILLKARARLDVMNNNKQTPIDLAIEHLLPADGLRMLQKGLEAESEVISVEV